MKRGEGDMFIEAWNGWPEKATYWSRDEVSGEEIKHGVGEARPYRSHLVGRGERDQHHPEVVEVEQSAEHGVEVPEQLVGRCVETYGRVRDHREQKGFEEYVRYFDE